MEVDKQVYSVCRVLGVFAFCCVLCVVSSSDLCAPGNSLVMPLPGVDRCVSEVWDKLERMCAAGIGVLILEK